MNSLGDTGGGVCRWCGGPGTAETLRRGVASEAGRVSVCAIEGGGGAIRGRLLAYPLLSFDPDNRAQGRIEFLLRQDPTGAQ